MALPPLSISASNPLKKMRIPIFARGANPSVDRRIQLKRESYCLAEVVAGRADWVNEGDCSQGILCRAFLYRGETIGPAAVIKIKKFSVGPGEVADARFRQPSAVAWQKLHGPSARALRIRAYCVYKAWKLQFDPHPVAGFLTLPVLP